MIEIDGSIGGGQVLRTAIGLSALTNEPVKITNIRTNRREAKPGLRPQHLMGIKVVAEFCDAVVHGLKEGSTTVQFTPQGFEVKSKKIDIGTAGSVTLLIQTLLPILIFNEKPVTLEIKGGTEVSWSPTVQYYKNVTFPLLKKLGASLDIEIVKHGYYPKGGGVVKVSSKPTNKLRAWVCKSRGEILNLYIDSFCGSFLKGVAKEQCESALKVFQFHYPDKKVSVVYGESQTPSSGSSCTCYALCENSILGASSLGERGFMGEKIGESAAEELVTSLKTGACLDKYMADQILPFLALAHGESSITIEGATDHFITNIQVIEKMLPVKFNVKGNEVSVRGVGWEEK
ncbi:MAG: RNA 3'-terminal phosphate cyclase [Candidatus Aenigmatarchaeota archaeon]